MNPGTTELSPNVAFEHRSHLQLSLFPARKGTWVNTAWSKVSAILSKKFRDKDW